MIQTNSCFIRVLEKVAWSFLQKFFSSNRNETTDQRLQSHEHHPLLRHQRKVPLSAFALFASTLLFTASTLLFIPIFRLCFDPVFVCKYNPMIKAVAVYIDSSFSKDCDEEVIADALRLMSSSAREYTDISKYNGTLSAQLRNAPHVFSEAYNKAKLQGWYREAQLFEDLEMGFHQWLGDYYAYCLKIYTQYILPSEEYLALVFFQGSTQNAGDQRALIVKTQNSMDDADLIDDSEKLVKFQNAITDKPLKTELEQLVDHYMPQMKELKVTIPLQKLRTKHKEDQKKIVDRTRAEWDGALNACTKAEADLQSLQLRKDKWYRISPSWQEMKKAQEAKEKECSAAKDKEKEYLEADKQWKGEAVNEEIQSLETMEKYLDDLPNHFDAIPSNIRNLQKFILDMRQFIKSTSGLDVQNWDPVIEASIRRLQVDLFVVKKDVQKNLAYDPGAPEETESMPEELFSRAENSPSDRSIFWILLIIDVLIILISLTCLGVSVRSCLHDAAEVTQGAGGIQASHDVAEVTQGAGGIQASQEVKTVHVSAKSRGGEHVEAGGAEHDTTDIPKSSSGGTPFLGDSSPTSPPSADQELQPLVSGVKEEDGCLQSVRKREARMRET